MRYIKDIKISFHWHEKLSFSCLHRNQLLVNQCNLCSVLNSIPKILFSLRHLHLPVPKIMQKHAPCSHYQCGCNCFTSLSKFHPKIAPQQRADCPLDHDEWFVSLIQSFLSSSKSAHALTQNHNIVVSSWHKRGRLHCILTKTKKFRCSIYKASEIPQPKKMHLFHEI